MGPLELQGCGSQRLAVSIGSRSPGGGSRTGMLDSCVKVLVGVTTRVTVGPPGAVERTLVGKARRVVDRRPR